MYKVLIVTTTVMVAGFWTDNYRGIDGVKCCGRNDCRVVDPSNFVDRGEDIFIKNTGELFPKKAIKPSEDGKFYQCFKSSAYSTRCVFFPVGV